jgi:hypothetical protein
MSHVIGTWAVSLHTDTDLQSEATMASELSGGAMSGMARH